MEMLDGWSWDRIREKYSFLLAAPIERRPDFHKLGLAMLKILPTLEANLKEARLRGYMSHGALCFDILNTDHAIYIFADDVDSYRISFYSKDQAEPIYEEHTAADKVLDVVDKFVKIEI